MLILVLRYISRIFSKSRPSVLSFLTSTSARTCANLFNLMDSSRVCFKGVLQAREFADSRTPFWSLWALDSPGLFQPTSSIELRCMEGLGGSTNVVEAFVVGLELLPEEALPVC